MICNGWLALNEYRGSYEHTYHECNYHRRGKHSRSAQMGCRLVKGRWLRAHHFASQAALYAFLQAVGRMHSAMTQEGAHTPQAFYVLCQKRIGAQAFFKRFPHRDIHRAINVFAQKFVEPRALALPHTFVFFRHRRFVSA